MTADRNEPEHNIQQDGTVQVSPDMHELKQRDDSKRRITAAYVSVPLMMLASVMVGVPLVLFNMFSLSIALIMTVAAEIIAILAGLTIIKSGKDWRNALRLKNFNIKQAGIGAGIGVILFILLQALAMGVNAITPEGSGIESSETSTLLASAAGIELYLIMLVLVPFVVPFIEEVFFRGYIFGFLKDSRAPIWSAFLVSIVYFALLHAQGFSTFGDMFIIAWTGVIAFAHAFLVHKYDSIWPAVFSHVVYNLITAVISLIQMQG